MPAEECRAEQNRHHRRAGRGANAVIGAKRHEMRLRHRHRHAAGEDRTHLQRKDQIRRPAHHRLLPTGGGCRRGMMRRRRRLLQKHRRGRHNDEKLKRGIIQHRMAPAGIGDHAREDRRPQRAGEISTARNQRQSRSAPAVEPAADIDVGRRIDAADADQADKQAVPDIKRPRRAQRGQRQPDRNHHRAKDDGPAHADPLGDPAHEDAADAGADPHQRTGKCRDGTLAIDLGGDVLKRNHGDPRRPKSDRHDHENHAGDKP